MTKTLPRNVLVPVWLALAVAFVRIAPGGVPSAGDRLPGDDGRAIARASGASTVAADGTDGSDSGDEGDDAGDDEAGAY
jgi:hypothetical protein